MSYFSDASKLPVNTPYGKTMTNKYKFIETYMVNDEDAIHLRNEYNCKQDTEFSEFIETAIYKNLHSRFTSSTWNCYLLIGKNENITIILYCLDKFVSI